jgi:DNA-binding IclR family transcriptional regulator
LSQKTDVDAVYLLRRINAEEQNISKQLSESELLYELDIVRQQGYAYTEGTVNPQAGVIAMQLPTPASQPHMVIGIGTVIAELRARREEFVEILKKTIQPYRVS